MRKNSGFTLMELMVGLAIIGILTAIAIPNLLEMLPMFRLKSAARIITTDMQSARGRCASLNKEYKIVFDLGTDEYEIFKGNDSYKSTAWISEKKISQLIDDKIDIFYIPTPPNTAIPASISVFFKPTGTVTMSNAVYIKNSKGDSKKITASINGRIKQE